MLTIHLNCTGNIVTVCVNNLIWDEKVQTCKCVQFVSPDQDLLNVWDVTEREGTKNKKYRIYNTDRWTIRTQLRCFQMFRCLDNN